MRLLFAGTPDVALPSLAALLASRHQVVAVLTRPAAPAGRGRHARPSPVAVRAAEHGLPVLQPRTPGEPEFLARLVELAPDCCPVVAYGALVPSAALAVPRHGWVNLHFSLLPAWRGAAPVQHAVLHGDDVTGASVFRLEPTLDTGPVYGQVTEPVRPADTSGDLLERLARSGADLIVRVLDGIEEDRVVAVPQPSDGISYAPRLDPDDVRVDWARPAVAVDRLVRAAWPAPGAWTTLRAGRVKLAPVRPVDPAAVPDPAPAPGAVVDLGRAGVLVGTGSVPVRLGEVRPEGRRAMAAADWARGIRLLPGEVLGR